MNPDKLIEDFIQDADIEVEVGRSEATFRHTIRNFSNVAKNMIPTRSPRYFVKNVPWNIQTKIQLNQLEFYIFCDLPVEDGSWWCKCCARHYRILPVRANVDPLVTKADSETIMNSQEPSRVTANLAKVDFLLDPKNGYIKNDAITLEMYIYVAESVVDVSWADSKKSSSF